MLKYLLILAIFISCSGRHGDNTKAVIKIADDMCKQHGGEFKILSISGNAAYIECRDNTHFKKDISNERFN